MHSLADDISLLRALMASEPVTGAPNTAIADMVCHRLEHSSARVRRLEGPDGHTNILALRGPEPAPLDPQGLTLCGHLDVVAAEEPDWSQDPFALTEREDRLVGRGSADMLGFVAVAIGRFLNVEESNLRAPLALLLTAEEERGSRGAQALRALWGDAPPFPRDVLIGEPTRLRVVRLHKGHVTLRITIHGVPAHSGYPHLGRSAIEPVGPILTELARLAHALSEERVPDAEHFPDAPYCTMNVGRIRGGVAANVIPERCEMDIGLRPLPGMDVNDLILRLRHAAARGAGDASWELLVTNVNPPMRCPNDAPLVTELSAITGQQGTESGALASDAGWLSDMGCRCVLFGPGAIEDAHKADEFVPLHDLVRAGEVVETLIARRCAETGE